MSVGQVCFMHWAQGLVPGVNQILTVYLRDNIIWDLWHHSIQEFTGNLLKQEGYSETSCGVY